MIESPATVLAAKDRDKELVLPVAALAMVCTDAVAAFARKCPPKPSK